MTECHVCGSTATRPYMTGPCCPAHTPAAIVGRPEAYVDPTLTFDALYARRGIRHAFQRSDSSLIDDRSVASGRRRSNTQTWKMSRAAEEERRAAEKSRREAR